jgi:septum formation protein
MPPSLILASTSLYRRQLLGRLGVPFSTESPGIDESTQPGEGPLSLVGRLARAKAAAVAARHPDAWVLGSDQIALRETDILGKPGSSEACVAQLLASSGREVAFLTAVCLLRARDSRRLEHVDTTRVHFRQLAECEVRRYVALEQPLDCAGGFKSEGLGIALFESIESADPTALVGLPLIWVARALREAGLDPLGGEP